MVYVHAQISAAITTASFRAFLPPQKETLCHSVITPPAHLLQTKIKYI